MFYIMNDGHFCNKIMETTVKWLKLDGTVGRPRCGKIGGIACCIGNLPQGSMRRDFQFWTERKRRARCMRSRE